MKSVANGGSNRATGSPIPNHLRIDRTSGGLRPKLCGNVPALAKARMASHRSYLPGAELDIYPLPSAVDRSYHFR
jgi:hypothetical protein